MASPCGFPEGSPGVPGPNFETLRTVALDQPSSVPVLLLLPIHRHNLVKQFTTHNSALGNIYTYIFKRLPQAKKDSKKYGHISLSLFWPVVNA